jgi:AraC-like DNA-binding protein
MNRQPPIPPVRPRPEPEFFSPQVAQARRFYLNLQPPSGAALAVVCGGLEHCAADYEIRRAAFPFYSIEYVARGRGEVKLKERTFTLQPGRLFAYGPGVPHHIRGDAGDLLVKYFVDFTGTGAKALLRASGLASKQATEVFPANSLQPLFDELIQVGLQGRPGGSRLCAKLLECLGLRIADARAPITGAETLAFSTYQQCRGHIERHFLRLKTLEQIAAECHANNAYLCRLFRRYDRQSPYQFLLRLKMNHAAERLRQPNVLVKQVAEETGFSDPFHFSRLFKDVLGLSPDSFRRIR